MKNLKVLILFSLAFLLSLFTYGQQQVFTKIQKNINKDAASLEQLLNVTLDTLTLKSDLNILRVTFFSHNEINPKTIDVDAPDVKIPLYHFKKGRYTIVVYRADKMIALGLTRIETIIKPKNAINDLELSVLKSSLSEVEQVARGIQLFNKEPEVSKVEDTRVTVSKSSKTKEKPNKPISTQKKSELKVISNVNIKSSITNAVKIEEPKQPKRVVQLKNESKNNNVVVRVSKQNLSQKNTTLIKTKKLTYNLSQVNNDRSKKKQTRKEYRANNLRPNGTRYDN